jgi:hypothetical protein
VIIQSKYLMQLLEHIVSFRGTNSRPCQIGAVAYEFVTELYRRPLSSSPPCLNHCLFVLYVELLLPTQELTELVDCIVNVSVAKYVALLTLSGAKISHQLSIEQGPATIVVDHGGDQRYWCHGKTGPHNDEEVGHLQILPKKPPESVWQTLSD